MKKNKTSASNGYRFLWLITGLLIGIFICSLSFLKKQVVVVENSNDTATTHQTAVATKQTAHVHKKSESKSTTNDATDQYDFYTILPQMKANQTPNTDTPANPPPKATKPLAVAEQSMLSPQNKQTPPASPAPDITNQTTTLQQPTTEEQPAPANHTAPSTPAPIKTSYQVIAGDFDTFQQADAHKAELSLAGIDRAKIEKYTKNDTTRYRVSLGHYVTEARARQTLQQLKTAEFSGSIITTPLP